jgi:hypothetical protein
MDAETKRILDALREGGNAHLDAMHPGQHDDALINIKSTDLRAVIAELDRVAALVPASK